MPHCAGAIPFSSRCTDYFALSSALLSFLAFSVYVSPAIVDSISFILQKASAFVYSDCPYLGAGRASTCFAPTSKQAPWTFASPQRRSNRVGKSVSQSHSLSAMLSGVLCSRGQGSGEGERWRNVVRRGLRKLSTARMGQQVFTGSARAHQT